MKSRRYLPVYSGRLLPCGVIIALLAPAVTRAAPAWGGNCMACHSQVLPTPLLVISFDGWADPDESATGAPDRGTLKVFHGFQSRTNRLTVQVYGLAPDDTYAVQLTRLRHAGVVNGAGLAHFPDCDWAEWGDVPGYYTQPEVAYQGETGPLEFTFEIEVYPWAGVDYFDLVFAIAGKFGADDFLFYGDEHFYLQVVAPGDVDQSGILDLGDVTTLLMCLGGPEITEPPPETDPAAFALSDLDDDEDADLADFAQFQALYFSY